MFIVDNRGHVTLVASLSASTVSAKDIKRGRRVAANQMSGCDKTAQ